MRYDPTPQKAIPAKGHTVIVDPAVPATCTESGLTEGAHCSVCGKVLAARETVPAKGHTAGSRCAVCGEALDWAEDVPVHTHMATVLEAVPPTCTEPGLTEGSYCAVCGEILVKQETVPPDGHIEVTADATEATCTEDGMTEGVYCAVCNAVLVEQETIPAMGHTVVTIPAYPATCTAAGLTEGQYCSVCYTLLKEQTETPETGHTEVTDPAVAPTCTEPGFTEGKHCSACGAVLKAQQTIAALGHSYAEGAAVTVTRGIRCLRCSHVAIPSFNDLVNRLKTEDHVFAEMSHTTVTVNPPTYSGVMVLFRNQFEEAISDSIGSRNAYSDLKERVPLNDDSFELIGSDKVSLLTEDDAQSVTAQQISGLDFLSDVPSFYVSENKLPCDMSPYLRRPTGAVLKINVTLQPESYSESASAGGSLHIDKIRSGYGEKVTAAIQNLHGFNEGTLRAEGEIYSNAAVTYYFDAQTLSPLAAVYTVVTDTAQKINIYHQIT